MKNLLFFLFLTYFSLSFGQTLNGFVFDAKTNKPIKGAHVYTSAIEQGTTTNFRGKFRLKLQNAPIIDSIYISHIGYKIKACQEKAISNQCHIGHAPTAIAVRADRVQH